ncbi:hypothetical protein GIR22_17510 [Pseudomonas sp. CCM 7891]|uniref:MYND finger n=1 Tax=Pseudomonas karstica TaxID=1055468 RepID=A0A7X2RTR1_9PSED|nr:PP0621 family protein [Pseudomonas karstica]MTD20927.1 hypothetical protein [Pseudomonas karstica]
MVSLLFWIVPITVVVWLWRKSKRSAQAQQRPSEPGATPMVRCAHCGVHIPQDRALGSRQEWYCTPAHLELGPTPTERQ